MCMQMLRNLSLLTYPKKHQKLGIDISQSLCKDFLERDIYQHTYSNSVLIMNKYSQTFLDLKKSP